MLQKYAEKEFRMGKGGSIADVHCPKCGAPAKYDIIRGLRYSFELRSVSEIKSPRWTWLITYSDILTKMMPK